MELRRIGVKKQKSNVLFSVTAVVTGAVMPSTAISQQQALLKTDQAATYGNKPFLASVDTKHK